MMALVVRAVRLYLRLGLNSKRDMLVMHLRLLLVL